MPVDSIPPPLTRLARLGQRVLRGLMMLAAAGASIVLVAWLILQWGILPRIDRWKPEIEAWASRASGAQVRIERIEVEGSLWSPMVTLSQVQLRAPDGSEGLSLQTVRAVLVPSSLVPRSLTAWEPSFDQLWIDAPALQVRRDARGAWWIAGIALSRADADATDNPALDWLLRQREVALRGGDVTFTDELRSAPPVALRHIALVLRNSFVQHRLRLDAASSADPAHTLTVIGEFRHSLLTVAGLQRPGDWRRWRGRLFVRAPVVDAGLVSRHVALPYGLTQGRAAVQGWIDVDRAEVTGVDLDLAARDLRLAWHADAAPMSFDTLSGRLLASHRAPGAFQSRDHVEVSLQGLQFDTDDGLHWPASTLTLTLDRASDGAVLAGTLASSALELPAMTRLSRHAPLPPALRRVLDDMHPRGRLLSANLKWQGPPDAPTSYWAAARAEGVWLDGADPPEVLDVHTHPRRPGVRAADADFELTERGGRATVSLDKGALELPGVFDDPVLAFDQFAGEVQWRIDRPTRAQGAAPDPDVTVQWRDVRFSNADLQGQAQGTWRTGKPPATARTAANPNRFPGVLELDAQIDHARADAVHRYLPVALPEATRHYLRDALVSGDVEDLTARVRGDLMAFPFAHAGSGEFTLNGRVRNAELRYVPDDTHPWPVFTRVSTELEINRQSLRLRRGKAELGRVGSGTFTLNEIEGRIDELGHGARLQIEGRGKGPADDGLRYVRESPVGGWIGHALDPATATGMVDLALALDIPLADTNHTAVRGQVLLANNTVQLRPDVPALADARARVDFRTDGFSVSAGSARVAGGPLAFEGGQQADGSVRFTGQGTATAEGLRRLAEWPALARLATQFSGQARYQLQLGFVQGQTELLLNSSLAGLGARLPAPLGKAEAAELPLRVSLQPQPGAAAGNSREALRVELGNTALAQYLRESGPDGTRVLRGQVQVGQPAEPLPALAATGTPGVVAAVSLPAVSVDAWVDWWRRFSATPGAPAASGTPASPAHHGPPASRPGADDGSAYLPTTTRLRTNSLTLGNQSLANVDVTVAQDSPRETPGQTWWRSNITSDRLAGRLEWRVPNAAPSDLSQHLVRARLSRLTVAHGSSTAAAHTEAPPRQADPLHGQRLPELDVDIDDLQWGERHLGRLELRGDNRGDGSAGRPTEWRLSRLALITPEAALQAQGNWAAVDGNARAEDAGTGRQRTALTFQLDWRDAGAWLDRLGWGGAVRRGTGQASGELSWPGSPLAFELAALSGQAHLGVDKGQFLRAEPGVARLLGVLSVQSLARRLTLDFSDVFGDGFAFDRMDGDVTLANGVAATRNLRIRGVQAVILTEGQTDLVRETQDLHMWIVPEVNAGAASLAYAAINPAVGIGTLIGQLFLRKTIAEATTRELRVGGTWDAPQVAQVAAAERRPAPTAAAATAAASAPEAEEASGAAPAASAPAPAQ